MRSDGSRAPRALLIETTEVVLRGAARRRLWPECAGVGRARGGRNQGRERVALVQDRHAERVRAVAPLPWWLRGSAHARQYRTVNEINPEGWDTQLCEVTAVVTRQESNVQQNDRKHRSDVTVCESLGDPQPVPWLLTRENHGRHDR